MATTDTERYRGYKIVPMRQWESWCAGVYPTRADLPILTQSTLRTLAPEREVAVAEAKLRFADVGGVPGRVPSSLSR